MTVLSIGKHSLHFVCLGEPCRSGPCQRRGWWLRPDHRFCSSCIFNVQWFCTKWTKCCFLSSSIMAFGIWMRPGHGFGMGTPCHVICVAFNILKYKNIDIASYIFFRDWSSEWPNVVFHDLWNSPSKCLPSFCLELPKSGKPSPGWGACWTTRRTLRLPFRWAPPRCLRRQLGRCRANLMVVHLIRSDTLKNQGFFERYTHKIKE